MSFWLQILECIYWVLCSCCGKKKKDPVVNGKKTGKPYRPGDLGQGERSTLVVVSPPASSTPRTYSNPSPPNYQVKEHLERLFRWLPYILAHKSRNFGQILANIVSIRLIRGSVFSTIQNTSKSQKYATKSSLLLLRRSTYTRVYTVVWLLSNAFSIYLPI